MKPTPTRSEREYSTSIEYDDHPEKEDYGPVHTRFDEEIELVHPVPDIAELFHSTHLTAQLHQYNRARQNDDWPFPNDGTTLYDVAILDVMDAALDAEGLSSDSIDMPTRRFKLLFLLKARRPATLKAFHTYVKNSPPVCTALGYDDTSSVPGYETLRIALKHDLLDALTDLERSEDAFDAAVIRAIYAAFRNGVEPPESVSSEYGFDTVSPPLYERNVPRRVRQTALRNWVRYLVDETLQPLTFHRTQPRTDFLQYLGLFAVSAQYGCGLQTVSEVADYNYPRGAIPKGSGIGKYIKDLPLNTEQAKLENTEKNPITSQFDAVHRATLEVAERHGFFEKPLSLASDLFRIEWNGAENDLTIDRPPKSENDTRSQWTYAVLGVIDTEARFTLGARWLPNKSEYPRVVSELSPLADEFIDVEALYADSELISGALLDSFREIADSLWAVRAPDHNTVIKKLKEHTPKNHIGYVPSVSWNTTPRPAAIAYPYDSQDPSIIEFSARELKQSDAIDTESQTSLSEFGTRGGQSKSLFPSLTEKFDDIESVPGLGDPSTHAAYLSDRGLPKHSAGGTHFPYYQRWALEESINQISNDVMPLINSSDEKLRLYGVNIAILFQNWHTLINRALSPELGLRCHVTHSEVLKAVEDVAFGNTD